MAQAKARVPGGVERPRFRSAPAAAPGYAAVLHGARALKGGRVRAADGRELVDLVNDRGAVLLGWADREVEAAVGALRNPELLEIEAAERLRALLPGAAAAAFRPSFESALADALLAAKLMTGRDGALFCAEAASYLEEAAALRTRLEAAPDAVAAVVVRPLGASRAFLAEARRLTRKAGALLIFDERKTAFRIHRGGAQALAGVEPDLTVIGAAIANGRPLAAVAGGFEPMRALPRSDRHVCAAALAGACVTLDRVDRADPARALEVVGAEIAAEVEARLEDTGAAAWFELSGDPVWTCVTPRLRRGLDPAALDAALAAGLYAEGVLAYGAHIPSLATGPIEVERLLCAYDAVLPELVAAARAGAFANRARRRAW